MRHYPVTDYVHPEFESASPVGDTDPLGRATPMRLAAGTLAAAALALALSVAGGVWLGLTLHQAWSWADEISAYAPEPATDD